MTEYCFESTNASNQKTKKVSDFTSLCSFILSHPLYLFSLIFFSPYLLKLLSFLSPIFITTSLLLLSLLTTLIPLSSVVNSKEGFFLTAYNSVLEKLHPKFDNEGEKLQFLEELEAYKIVFESSTIEAVEENPDEGEKCEENPFESFEEKVSEEEKGAREVCGSLSVDVETGDAKPNKVKEEVKKYEAFLTKSGFEAKKTPTNEGKNAKDGSLKFDDETKLSESFSQTVRSPPCLGSFGSMRKEKEWRRTLACKLFEERHNCSSKDKINGNTEEGMDLLWETYETESNRAKAKEEAKKRRKKRIEELMVLNDDEINDYGGNEALDDDTGKYCCLQALKLSAGKMNLSMGRPNLVKIGKAFKGIGWFQSHVRGQGKKVYK